MILFYNICTYIHNNIHNNTVQYGREALGEFFDFSTAYPAGYPVLDDVGRTRREIMTMRTYLSLTPRRIITGAVPNSVCIVV